MNSENQYLKVSVILPTYNRAHTLEKSINSVLEQTYKNLELIVIDDCSTDETKKVISGITDARLKYIFNKINFGPSKSRNIGIESSTGELIAFQDSDDEWYPDKLEKQVKLLMNSGDDVAGVYCGMEFYDLKSGNKIGEELREMDFKASYTTGSFFYTPANVTVLIKKSVLDEVGYFDNRLFADEDTELAIRVTKNYRYIFCNEILVKVKKNHDQLTGSAKYYTLAKEIIYEKHKNYLSKKILFGLCKQIANYYILTGNNHKALRYVKYALQHKRNLITIAQFLLLLVLPPLLSFAYKRKYKYGLPHPNDANKFLPYNT